MTETKNETTVFYPDGHHETKGHAASLTAKGRLIEYNQQLKANLAAGIRFTEILDVLSETKDTDELLEAALALSTYQLDSAYLVYPQQYSKSDFYLIFLQRLLQLHQANTMILESSERKKELHHSFEGISQAGYFLFATSETDPAGAYYYEKETEQRLFYINFKRHLLSFNSQALTNLLVVNYGKRYQFKAIKNLANLLIAVGKCFKEDYGYEVDFSYLDAANQARYPLTSSKLPQQALDRLFIKASQAGYMLTTGIDREAILDLGPTIRLSLFAHGENTWVMQVQDQANCLSWLDLLFKYEFLKDWYLENLDTIEVRTDSRYFKG